MPFGPYKDFDDCVTKQQQDGKSGISARRVCGMLQRDLEGKVRKKFKNAQGEEEDLSPQEIMDKAINADSIAQCASIMQEYGMHDNLDEAKAHCTELFQDKNARVEQQSEPEQQQPEQQEEDKPKAISVAEGLQKEKENDQKESLKIGAIVEKFSQNDHLFIKSFLLDASVNLNEWGVTAESLSQRIGSFIGKPLVLMENFDHPNLADKSLSHAMEYQEDFRIGNIIDITRKDDVYYAIIEITEDKAKDAFRNNDLPLYVSPAIAKLQLDEPEDAITNWIGIHVALVDKPAYTVRKAMITGQCEGKEQECLLQLRNARIKKDGYGSCGFCVKAALLSKVPTLEQIQQRDLEKVKKLAAADLVEKQKSEHNHKEENVTTPTPPPTPTITTPETKQPSEEVSSLVEKIDENNLENIRMVDNQNPTQQPANAAANVAPQQQQQQPQASVGQQVAQQQPSESTVPTATIVTNSQHLQQQTQPTISRLASNERQNVIINDPSGNIEAEFTRITARNEHLETALKTAQEQINKLQNENTKIVQAYRRSEFDKIISASIYPDPTKRAERIEELLQTSLTPEQVFEIYKDVDPTYVSAIQSQGQHQHPPTTSYHSGSVYESRMQYPAPQQQQQNSNVVRQAGQGQTQNVDTTNDLHWLNYRRALIKETSGRSGGV